VGIGRIAGSTCSSKANYTTALCLPLLPSRDVVTFESPSLQDSSQPTPNKNPSSNHLALSTKTTLKAQIQAQQRERKLELRDSVEYITAAKAQNGFDERLEGLQKARLF
jgi:hypothetical protein